MKPYWMLFPLAAFASGAARNWSVVGKTSPWVNRRVDRKAVEERDSARVLAGKCRQYRYDPVAFVLRFLTALLCLAGMPVSAVEAERPNIIFILADDLGYSDLGCYGGEIETPHLDSLARNGLRFTQFYNTARCWPTRGALLTGYYAQQIRRDALPNVNGGGQGVRPNWAPLLPDFLKAAGYRSYHSGKWHIDGDVLAGGFDRSFHTRNDGNFFTVKGNLLDDQPITPPADESNYYVTTATADHAIECLKDHAAHHAGKPFFQYIPFIAPHFPLHALPEDIAKYRDAYVAGWEAMREARFRRQQEMGILNTTLSALERDVGPPYAFPDAMEKLGPGEVNRPLPWTELTEEQRRFQATKMAIHAAMIDRMDQEIGRVIAQLKVMGAFDNTLIFFASDNGASAEIMVRHGGHDPRAAPGSASTYLCLGPGFSSACNTPFRRHKTWVHEGGISTPLIAHWPRGIAARNELRHTPAHVIDIVPTVLEVAGIQKPDAWNGKPIPPAPGRSLVPAFAKEEQIARDSLWWLHEGHRAIRMGDWKLVAAKGDPWELYNLKTDRAEQHNLAARMTDKVKELEQNWQQQTASFANLLRPPQPPQSGDSAAEPRSGVILRQRSKIIFDRQNTRTETYWDGKLASVFTAGKLGAWEAYQDVGRVVIHPIPEPNHWVIEHPDFGAFSARWIAPGDRPQTNEVLRIQVGATKSQQEHGARAVVPEGGP